MTTETALKELYSQGAGLDVGSPQNSPEYLALVKYLESGDQGPMRVKCPHCGTTSTIRSSKRMSKLVSEASANCNNIACGHTFVVSIEAVRTISPSAFPDPLVAAQLKQSVTGLKIYGVVPASKMPEFGEGKAMT